MGFFSLPLHVEQIEEGRWRLLSPFHFHCSGHMIVVPQGFETDFASVPRLPIAYLLAGGVGDRAAVIHDYLYRTIPHETTRKTADEIFYQALLACGISTWRAYLMWLAVRIGGNGSWVSEETHEPAG